jgi:DNA polymerase III epsilon subunit family exonuclease
MPRPAYNTPVEQLRIAVIDFETTGLRPWDGDSVIEIGAVLIDDLQVCCGPHLTALVNPGRPVSPSAFEVHGIPDDELAQQPPFGEVLPALLELLDGRVMAGHNVGFDLGFLRSEMTRLDRAPLPLPVLDTALLARVLLPRNPGGYGLAQVASQLDVPEGGDHPHRALPDALRTAHVLVHQLRAMMDKDHHTFGDLQRRCAQVAVSSGRCRGGVEPGVIDAVLDAIRDGEPVEITYVSPHGQQTENGRKPLETRRVIEPVSLRGLWVDAFCHLRQDLRTFRLDRIQHFEPFDGG